MRTDRSIIYHIYPLGFCAVEPRNGFASEPVNRISKSAAGCRIFKVWVAIRFCWGRFGSLPHTDMTRLIFCGWIAGLAQMTIFARLPRRFMLPA